MKLSEEKINENIEKAKKGNQAAFKFLLDNFWGDVYAFQFKKTQNENDAEDITIQTFSKAFDKIDTYKPAFKFKTWLITISKNIHIDLLRKKNTSISTENTVAQEKEVYAVADTNLSPEDQIITEQNLTKLLFNIHQLKPKYLEIINLRFFKELSYNEISEHLNEPISNVKVKLLRAKKILAEIIKNS